MALASPALIGRRACAVLAAISAGLHGLMVADAGNAVAGVLILAMMTVCLYCAYDLWTHGALQTWCVVALMNLGMVAGHWSAPGCHPATSLGQATPASTLMMTATSVALAEAVIATAVLFYLTRGRAAALALGRRELA